LTRRVEERDLALTAFVSPVPSLTGGGPEKIAILVPGIRTNADWIDEVSHHLETFSIPVRCIKAYGGRISTWHLFTRIGLSAIRAKVEAQINATKINNPHAEISLICHSMGTDIIFDVIDSLDFNFKTIFFIGGICHVDKANKIRRRCDQFINHVGVLDPWPVLASIFRPYTYSPVGTFGFGTHAYVNDFRFKNDHKTCTSRNHVTTFIIPVINGAKPLYSDPAAIEDFFWYNMHYYVRRGLLFTSMAAAIGYLFVTSWSLCLPVIVLLFVLYYYILRRAT
jgi:hypothetical protein